MDGLCRTIDLPPLILAVGSFLILFVSSIRSKCGGKSKGHSSNCTSPTLYFNVARVVMSMLLSLTIAIAWLRQDTRPSGIRAVAGTLYIAIAYAMLLTLLSVLGPGFGSSQLTRHVDFIFLCVFGAIAYHDFWSFFTLEGLTHRLDLYSVAEDALLGILGIVIPLTSPREYRPINDALPPKEPHPEQTASWLSLLLYSWLNPLIGVAYKAQHLAPDALFPLADYDHVAALVSRNSLHLESRGTHRSHVFFGLMKAFSLEYATLMFLVLVKVFLSLANPFALEQFLMYLETRGKGMTIRPIVWIILLFLSPVMYSILFQWSIFIETRVVVHAEALLSDLIFKQALRIRLQGGASDDISSDENKSNSQANLIGTINNHITTDLKNVTDAKDFLQTGIGVPLQIILCIAFLHSMLGWSAMVGAGAMVILFPVPGYVISLFQSVEIEKMKKTDDRVQLVSETMNVLRMIKLFGWERKINSRIQNRRAEELAWIKKRQLLQLLNNMTNFIIPIVVMLITYSVYTLVAKQNLTASIVFSSIAVFDILQLQIHLAAAFIPNFIQGKVALGRIHAFLSHDDIITCQLPRNERSTPHAEGDNDINSDTIGISQATFSWTKSDLNTSTPRNKHFTLSVHDELLFQHGELNLVTGPTGSGKTSLLMALLGEMYFHPSGPSSWCNLPRHLGVAYAAQESWILNRTIRDNILFGSDFDQGRYTEVLFQCALEPDLAHMEHGDLTEVGERGVTLSGGQKARITLARAIYSSAHILLLDDVFAALDVHTSHWIVDHCFRGKLVKGRTIIMATHNVSLVNDIARYVVTLDNEGQVQSHRPLETSDGGDTNVADTDQSRGLEVVDSSDGASSLETKVASAEVEGGTLTTAEKIAEGHVGWSAILLYLLGWGGRMPVLNWGLFIFGLSVTHISKASQSWYLGYWAEQYQESSTVSVGYNVTIYTFIMCSTVVLYSLSCTIRISGSLRASKTIHDRFIERIFGTTFRWLDMTPVARVITRCTQDIGTVDGKFPEVFMTLVELTIMMLVNLAAVVYLAPPFALPGLIVAIAGGWYGQVYMKAELSVKRELSNAKAPILAHLGAALAGLVSVRAFGAQSMFIQEYHASINHYTRVARTFHALNCWVSVRLESLGALFVAALAAYMMYGHHNINPSNVGFSLDMAVNFSAFILWWIVEYNGTEINGNSLERIASYMDIEQETEAISKPSPPAYWPASGDLRVENLSARYSSDGPNVLHDLSFHIRTGERIGTVGRTGSGKTSLSLSLLRCLPTGGEVYYDSIPTSSIELEVLRSSLTIIPQSAELLNGTIRQNLDPFDQFDDAVLNSSLQSAGLSELQGSSHNSRLTLDTPVTTGGSNLSVGQRQIIALARAMVRESKLLLLDEATSAIDHKTDAAIQKSLREMKGVTQLIIAHRLQSVMDTDRIIVLNAGRIVELDTPSQLLQREDSLFRTLVYASEDKEALLAMVKHSA